MFFRSFLTLALAITACHVSAVPQMLVYGNSFVAVPSGQNQADDRTGTDFGRAALPMTQATTRTLEIVNLGDQPLVITQPFQFTGPKGTAFSLVSLGSDNLAPGTTTSMVLAFDADSNGQYTTDMRITSNDPATPDYSVPLRGMAGNNAPASTPDATVAMLENPTLLKFNVNKQTGKYFWYVHGYNLNEVLPQKGASIRCWYSTDPYLDPLDLLVKEKAVKKFGPYDANLTKLVKLKVKAPGQFGYLFAEIFLTPDGAAESNYTNNIIIATIGVN